MKKSLLLLIILITVLFTSCVRTAYKGADKEVVEENVNNIFN